MISLFTDTTFPVLDHDLDFALNWGMRAVKKTGLPWLIDQTEQYIRGLYKFAPAFGLSPFLMLCQFLEETAGGTSAYWKQGNPAGIGIFADGVKSPITYEPGVNVGYAAAAIHVVELWLRTQKFPASQRGLMIRDLALKYPIGSVQREALTAAIASDEPHVNKVLKLWSSGAMPVAQYLSHLNLHVGDDCLWACDPNYAVNIEQYVVSGSNERGTPPVPTSEQKMSDFIPAFVLTAGHRQTVSGGGAWGEPERTPLVVNAYYNALKAAGYEVHWVQREDGDSDPDDVVGGLDTASAEASRIIAALQNQGKFVILLDCHFEGADPSVRGLFAIYPRSNGLGTAIQVCCQDNDLQGNNVWDEQYGLAVAKSHSAATGIPLRASGVKQPGLMGEDQTGVAGQYSARLATFAYTAPQQPNAIRLVIEHGAVTNKDDLAIIDSPGYYNKLAASLVATTKNLFKSPGAPEPPKPTTPELPKPNGFPEHGNRIVQYKGSTWYPLGVWVHAGPKGAGGRVNGGLKAPVVMTIEAGKEVFADWIVKGQGGVWFYVSRAGYRLPVTDFVEQYSIKLG